MGSEGSYTEEIPQISDTESELKNPQDNNAFFEEFTTITQEVLGNEETSISLEYIDDGMTSQKTLNKNGEQSDILAELKISLTNELCTDIKSDNSDHCEETTEFIRNDIKILSSTPVKLPENENVSQIKDKSQVFEDVALDISDGISKVFSQSNDEIQTLNDTIDEAIQNHLDSEDLSNCSRESGMKCDGRDDFREVSVQTAMDKFFIVSDPCPICKLQRDDVNDLKALCLEYPPYKKLKVTDSSDVAENTSDDGNENDDKYFEGSEETQLRRKLAISQDQVVPKSEVNKGTDSNFTESASRPIRLGLSKRVKPRPLHLMTKFQAADSAETDS